MFGMHVDYASASAYSSTRERDALGFAANTRRPVVFDAVIEHDKLAFRQCLRALGELIWSDDHWFSNAWFGGLMDPVVTVHPDRVFFEAFSQDQSAYAQVIAPREVFRTKGEVLHGTTNVDFTAWLWAALGELRSSRQSHLRIASEGIELQTEGLGGRFEKKVELPEDWVRGFLTVQSAMALPGTRVSVRPVDMLAALRTLRFQNAKLSPRALRYEFEPGQDAQLVLEPWEQVIALKGAVHNYEEKRSIRTWGRRRLRLIEPLLPYADELTVYLKGRALPSAYVVRIGRISFVLTLSGWTGNNWSRGSSFDLGLDDAVDEETVARVHGELVKNTVATTKQSAETLGLAPGLVEQAFARLCRRGRCIFDLERRNYRHRELFENPVEEKKLFLPDRQLELAQTYIRESSVEVTSSEVRQTRKSRKLRTPDGPVRREIIYRDFNVLGQVGEQAEVSIVVNQLGRIIFGTCGCEFFSEHILNQGPCGHMIALLRCSADHRIDAATSVAAPEISSDAADEPEDEQ